MLWIIIMILWSGIQWVKGPITTELKNMEWNYLVSPSQADGKNWVYDVLFLTSL